MEDTLNVLPLEDTSETPRLEETYIMVTFTGIYIMFQ